jgi:hypothetical protein
MRLVEGVVRFRFRVRFKTTDGLCRRFIHYSPAAHYARQEVGRILDERFGLEKIVAHSALIERVDDGRLEV